MLNEKQIVKMCEALSYKYNSERHREDLQMEGIVKCYEILATEPDAHPAKLHREVKRRLHDYLNLDTQPVSIPKHSRSRRLTRNINDGGAGDMSEKGFEWLKLVIQAEDRPYDEDYSLSDKNQAGDYERKDHNDYIKSVVSKTLSPTELLVIKLRYYEDFTLEEVGEVIGTNKMWVSRHEKAALKKLGRTLM
jgi:RNA polymerase sigma factor (sigma-70 family)